jgi:transcriptional regulator with XRE-family HTH domain
MYPSVDWIVGRNLCRLREERGFTQAALGALVDMGAADIARCEQGGQRISALTIYALAMALGAPISAFFEGFDAEEAVPPAPTLTLH